VLEVAYDQYQLHRTATEFNNKRICFWKVFGQQQDRLIADNQVYQMVKGGNLAHSGEPDLSDHVTKANAKTSTDEDTKVADRLIGRSKHGN